MNIVEAGKIGFPSKTEPVLDVLFWSVLSFLLAPKKEGTNFPKSQMLVPGIPGNT